MLKKLVIIGANEFQEQLVLKAKELGYETHVFAWEEGAVAKKHADFFYPISIIEKEKILEIVKKIKPQGIISIGSDVAVLTVNYVAQELGLTGNTMYSSLISTNKFEMRKAFKKNNISCPKYKLIKNIDDVISSTFNYPVIIKPVDRSGSRGIFKVETLEELKNYAVESMSLSFKKEALIEEFVEGKEYSVEMISYKGHHHFLALTEKFTTGAPNFIETMHFEPASVDDYVKNKIIDEVKKGLDSLEIKNGASHSELKIDENNNIKIIEIGARMGGDCIGSDLVKISTGYDFVKMVVDVAVGVKPDLEKISPHRETAFVKFIFNKTDLDIFYKIKEKYKQNLFRFKITENICIREIKDSSARFGYYILKGISRNEILNILEYKDEN